MVIIFNIWCGFIGPIAVFKMGVGRFSGGVYWFAFCKI